MNEEEFLDNGEVQDIAQAHLERIVQLENRESDRVIKAYRRIRQELRDRLDSLSPGTFTAQRLRGVMVQIDSAIAASSRGLKSDMDSSAQMAAEKGVEDLLSELGKYNKMFAGAVTPINVDAIAIATDTKNFLFNRYETSIASYNQVLRTRFSQGITNAAIEEISMSELVGRISKTFLGEEWQIQRIVRTELHNIYGLGKLNVMTDLWDEGKGDIPDLKKALFHPRDARTAADSIYAAKLELVVNVDQPFKYKWKGETRVFMSPPDRPNDRSILIPYRESWK